MYVRVMVTPAAKRQRFAAAGENDFEAAVKEPAERNLANRRVRELVAAHYGVLAGKVRLVSGHRSPKKVFSVEVVG